MNITLAILFALLGTVIMFKPSYVVGIDILEDEKTVVCYHLELPYGQALYEFFHHYGNRLIVNRKDYIKCVEMMEDISEEHNSR